MRVDLGDQLVSVGWSYASRDTIIGYDKHGKAKVRERKFTICIIKPATKTKDEKVEAIMVTESGCHSEDVFCKNKGRIRSLTKALKNLYPHSTTKAHYPENKRTRAIFWDAYKDMRNGAIMGKGRYHAPIIALRQAIPI